VKVVTRARRIAPKSRQVMVIVRERADHR